MPNTTEPRIVEIDVSFTQLAVFNSLLEDPFNDWSDSQVEQGYAWRPESVSFRTLEDGPHKVEVIISDDLPNPTLDVVRAITVPLRITGHDIEIASISDGELIPADPGEYQLLCEFIGKRLDGTRRVRITLRRSAAETFAVLVADR
jgi:hypothetical protein